MYFHYKTITIKEYDNGRYEGEFKYEKRECKRKYFYKIGDVYEGSFKKGGKGVYTYSIQDKYVEEYKEGRIEEKGVYEYIDGDRYEGDYKNDHRDGIGTYTIVKVTNM